MTRIFKIGSTQVVEDPSLQNLTTDEIRERLKASFPEVAEATVRERTEGDTTFLEFLPRAGRKG